MAVVATSRNLCRFSPFSPITSPVALIESVTRSEVRARSKFVASESLRTLGRAFTESSTLHPANAMYSKALADSVAVFVVSLPYFMAASLAMLNSSSLAFAVPFQELIALSKSIPTSTAFFPAINAAAEIVPIATTPALPIFFIALYGALRILSFFASCSIGPRVPGAAACFAISLICFLVRAALLLRLPSMIPMIRTASLYSLLAIPILLYSVNNGL